MRGRFVAARPCVELEVVGFFRPLALQADTFGDYDIALPAHVANAINCRPGLSFANHRLLDGRSIPMRRAEIDIVVAQSSSPVPVTIGIFRHFNVVGHPGLIDGFVGERFLKSYHLDIDYPNFYDHRHVAAFSETLSRKERLTAAAEFTSVAGRTRPTAAPARRRRAAGPSAGGTGRRPAAARSPSPAAIRPSARRRPAARAPPSRAARR